MRFRVCLDGRVNFSHDLQCERRGWPVYIILERNVSNNKCRSVVHNAGSFHFHCADVSFGMPKLAFFSDRCVPTRLDAMQNCKPLQNNADGKRAYRNAKHVKGLYSFATVGVANVALRLSQQIQRLDSHLVVSIVACCNRRRPSGQSQGWLLEREPWLPYFFLPLLFGGK